ncbi:vacuolar fusion protein CCZ1 homolog isoform X2 [Antedon mediterranea]|uniref:vacuolar fusion protein CCZ1 homolog isoform X2 n=1 Tax=Antedon mediterranea TaxID=105859 RepID=UPI003AF873D2
MMTTRTCISLLNFFIYNPEYGPREGEEHKKIMFYHPDKEQLDVKIKNIGLSEAVVKFTQTFLPNKPCEAIHTQKNRQLFLEAEKDFWMVMTVAIPYTEKVVDGKPLREYHPDDVQDSVYQAVLTQAYKMFKLFMGTFYGILKRTNVEQLQHRLAHFFNRYISTLKLSQCDILDVHAGIQFLPLDKNTYLRIQCFINLIEANFSRIKHTAFLYNDHLVWSGLEQDDMRVLYRYLTTNLFPTSLDTELKEAPPSKVLLGQAVSSSHYGKYVTGPPDLSDAQNLGKIPKIHVNSNTEQTALHLVVYRALSATVCLMVEADSIPSFNWFKEIDNFIGPQLTKLASDISEQQSSRRSPSISQEFKFVYFNQMNLAEKSTVHNRKTSSSIISPDILRLLADINSDFMRSEFDEETIMKTSSECWVAGKKSDQREFYVVLNLKNSNLIEVNEEVKRLCAAQFSNIFFLD